MFGITHPWPFGLAVIILWVLAGKIEQLLQRARFSLTHLTPLYQHLLTNAGECTVSGRES
jgi:hypothetical protein